MSNSVVNKLVVNKLAVPSFAPFWTLYEREMKRFMKVVFQTVVSPLVTATLYLLIFGVSLGDAIVLSSGLSYMAFLIPGLIMMSVLNNAFQNSSSSIVSGKFSGDLEDLRVVPLGNHQILWALSVGGLTRGLIVGLVTFIVGEIFYYVAEGSLLSVAHPGWLMFFLVVGGLSFSKLGVPIAFWARSFDQVSAVGSFVLLPLIYLGGVFFSLENLHPFWKVLSSVNPVLYFINGVRFGLLGISDVNVYSAAAVSVTALVVFHLIALRSLKTGNYQRW